MRFLNVSKRKLGSLIVGLGLTLGTIAIAAPGVSHADCHAWTHGSVIKKETIPFLTLDALYYAQTGKHLKENYRFLDWGPFEETFKLKSITVTIRSATDGTSSAHSISRVVLNGATSGVVSGDTQITSENNMRCLAAYPPGNFGMMAYSAAIRMKYDTFTASICNFGGKQPDCFDWSKPGVKLPVNY